MPNFNLDTPAISPAVHLEKQYGPASIKSGLEIATPNGPIYWIQSCSFRFSSLRE
jgi:hypothetical protein